MFARAHLAYLLLREEVRRRLAVAFPTADAGVTTAEYIVWIGVAVTAALAVGAIVTGLLKAKANSLKLN